MLSWALALICIFPARLLAQEMVFSAQASAEKIGLQDQLQVSFNIQNAPAVTSFKAPAFSGFRVLGEPFQSNQSSISIMNGQRTETTVIRLTYVLQPLRTGSLSIDPATITIDGHRYTTNAIKVDVVRGHVALANPRGRSNDPFGSDPFDEDDPFEAMRRQQQQMQQLMRQRMQQLSRPNAEQSAQMEDMDEKNLNKNIFIKVTVDKTHPHVGEQITASYKLYTRLPMNMSLTQLPSLNGFWSEDFKIPNPPKPTQEVVNGKVYQVFLLKKSALFPQQSGKLTLDAAKAEGVVRVLQKVQGQNPFADDPGAGSLFMNDPFFDSDFFSGYNYKDVKTNLSSAPVTIDVQPLPEKLKPDSFTGGVGNFTVHAEADSATVSTDGSVAFRFIVSGSGNLKLIGNPAIAFPDALDAMEPQVTDTILSRTPTINGRKIFTYTLSPQQPGTYTIPPVVFTYFDPVTETYKTLHTDPVKLKVIKGKNYASGLSKNDLPADIHDIETTRQTWKMHGRLFVASPGYWMLYPLALLIFTIALFLNRRKTVRERNAVLWKTKKANKVAWKRLARARRLLTEKAHTAFYEEISKAIWLYLSDKLNIPLSVLSKENIAGALAARNVSEVQVAHVHALLSECELALYSPSGGLQQREHMLNNASALIGNLENVLQAKKQKSVFNNS